MLKLTEQLALCQQVAHLVKCDLPIAGELTRITDDSASSVTSAVDQQLAAGKSLAATLAGDDSRNSRILSACIEVGERSGRLQQSLEAWTHLHLVCRRYSQALRGALVYPALLILVMLASLGYVVWQLVPEYRQTFQQFNAQLPSWLAWLVEVREQLGWLIAGIFVAAIAPLGLWYWHRQSFDRWGLPREPARRLQGQVLSTELLRLGVAARLPITELVPLCIRASGGAMIDAEQAVAKLEHQEFLPHLARETSLLLTSLHAGQSTAEQTCQHLIEVADALAQHADARAAQTTRWLPMLVALTVGTLTVLTYVFLIYLPWIELLQWIVDH